MFNLSTISALNEISANMNLNNKIAERTDGGRFVRNHN